MKIRGPLFVSVIALTFMFAAFYPNSVDNAEKETVLMRTILTFVNQLHYNPKDINDDFSADLYTFYLDRLDGARRFLVQEDIKQMEAYKYDLDDELMTGSYVFFDLSIDLLAKGISKAKGYYPEILDVPFDFTKNEFFEVDGEKRGFASNDAELKEYWRQLLKYETLNRVTRKLERQEEKGEEGAKKSMEELEQEAREEVREMFDDYFERTEKLKRSDRLSFYLNTVTQVFDPHTNYYEPIDKENFDIRMSGRYSGIGARLMSDGDDTKVSEIIVGGPAWKGKDLIENDVIVKIAQGEEGEWIDITGWVLDDVVQQIRGEKGTMVRFMVRKVDGTLEEVRITRDVVQIEETYAKSLILDTEEGKKVGYIFLPSFYADFDDPSGRFCSKDIAVELEKLKKENVDGVVLDLRSNGGGSLSEVVKMSGLFIEQGPIVQVKSRGRKPEVYNDVDPRVQYDGPLTVMTNSFSASASEILAAALQDYDRAVVVGSKSTFGKGTVQRFYDLDRAVRGLEDVKPLGQIKLTTQKFYRINGGSTQLKGVVPDVILPDSYHLMEVGEKDEDYPLAWTEIPPAEAPQQSIATVNNKEKLAKESEMRLKEDPAFQKVFEYATRLKEQRNESKYPLNLDVYREYSEQQQKEADAFRDMFKDVVNANVHNVQVDLERINADEQSKDRNEDFVQTVSKDIYIRETLRIMDDMIK